MKKGRLGRLRFTSDQVRPPPFGKDGWSPDYCGRSALTRVRGIVLEQLGHGLLEIAIVLVGILIDVERLGRRAARYELFCSRVEQCNDEFSDFDSRRRYSGVAPAAPPGWSRWQAIKLLFFRDRRLVVDDQISTLNPPQTLPASCASTARLMFLSRS